MSGLLAAAPFTTNPDKPKNRIGDATRIDFVHDGLLLSPSEYADLIKKLADENKLKTDEYSIGGMVEELENKFATLLGKESAVFMPTGTLANHIAIRKLAGDNRRIIVQEQSHIYNDSGDCAQTLSGLNLIPAGENALDFTLDEVMNIVKKSKTGRVDTRLGAISIETPVRRKQDRIFTYEKIKPIADYAKDNGIKTHLDGARIFIQSVHTNIKPAQYSSLFDTVYTSMYKCFNAPGGAILAGTKKFTETLFHERRMFGGGLRVAWPYAAIASYYADSFTGDYTTAWKNAQQLFAILSKNEQFSVSELAQGTHIVRVEIKGKDPIQFKNSMTKNNIQLNPPHGNGFDLKINPSINRIKPEVLGDIFLACLK